MFQCQVYPIFLGTTALGEYILILCSLSVTKIREIVGCFEWNVILLFHGTAVFEIVKWALTALIPWRLEIRSAPFSINFTFFSLNFTPTRNLTEICFSLVIQLVFKKTPFEYPVIGHTLEDSG